MIVPAEGFLLPSSRVPGGVGMVMDEIDTCIKHTNAKCFPLCRFVHTGMKAAI